MSLFKNNYRTWWGPVDSRPKQFRNLNQKQWEQAKKVLKTRAYRKKVIESFSSKRLADLPITIDSVSQFMQNNGGGKKVQKLLTHINGELIDGSTSLRLTFKQARTHMMQPEMYFTQEEAFVVAANLRGYWSDRIHKTERSMKEGTGGAGRTLGLSGENAKLKLIDKFMNRAKECDEEDDEKSPINEQVLIYEGICELDDALKIKRRDKKLYKKKLQASKKIFISLLEKGLCDKTAVSTLGLILGLQGKIDAALNFLIKAAQVAYDTKFFNALVSKLYQILALKKTKGPTSTKSAKDLEEIGDLINLNDFRSTDVMVA